MVETLFLVLTINFLAMLSPGPDFFVVSRNAILYARKPALLTGLGVSTGVIIHVSYCVVGLGFVLQNNTMLYSVIQYAGAAYLIYLGARTFMSKPYSHGPSQNENSLLGGQAFRQGLLTNLLNPKFSLFLISLFAQLIEPNTPLFFRIVFGSALVLENLIYWSALVMALQHRTVRQWLGKSQVSISRVFGIILILIAIRLVFY